MHVQRGHPILANKNKHKTPVLMAPPCLMRELGGDIPSITRYGRAAYGTVILSMLNEEYCHSFPVDDAYERSRELSPPSLRQRRADSLRA